MTYIVVILQIVTYVLFMLALTLSNHNERKEHDLNKILDKVIRKFRQENADLRYKNKELETTQRRIKRMVSSYEVDKTNIYTLVRDIKKELDESDKRI